MITILGAGGAIGNELVKLLSAGSEPVRLVARNPKSVTGMTTVSADLSDLDSTLNAVTGSRVVHLLAGLKYDIRVWRELWPRIMRNTIEACKHAQARLIFFDNVYMYGKVNGPMTEAAPFNPSSKKGEVRAQIATMLLNEIKAGNLTAIIARAADFYGPNVRTGIPNVLVFQKFAQGSGANWIANDHVPHSFTYTPDAAKGLMMLDSAETAWNQTWHLPTTSNPPTGKEFIALAAKEYGVKPRYRVLSPAMLKIVGWFNHDVAELHEMLYQNDSPYLFDSTKFERAFHFTPTPYAVGIKQTAHPA